MLFVFGGAPPCPRHLTGNARPQPSLVCDADDCGTIHCNNAAHGHNWRKPRRAPDSSALRNGAHEDLQHGHGPISFSQRYSNFTMIDKMMSRSRYAGESSENDDFR
jgi:hypothetical protein